MKLIMTPRSHFARKVRILLAALELEVECVDVGDVGSASSQALGANPLMKVPTLVDTSLALFDSDHIARHLVRQHSPADPFGVLAEEAEVLNARAVMNGVMAAEAEILLARRTGLDTDRLARFERMRASMGQGLDWLEEHAASFSAAPSYAAFHLTCLWDHIAFCDTMELAYPALAARVEEASALPFVAASAPR